MASDDETPLNSPRARMARDHMRRPSRPGRICAPKTCAKDRLAATRAADTASSSGPVVDILPMTLELCPDLDRLFRSDGGPYGAWGTYWRLQLSCLIQSRLKPTDYRFFMRKHLMTADRAPGLLAYVQDRPVGWVDVGPRRDFPKFNKARASAVSAQTDLDGLWAVPSLYVARRFRRLGLANNLVDAACVYAQRHGARAIDAAPWDDGESPSADAAAAGRVSDFKRQGFGEIARRVVCRPLMRRHFGRIIRRL